jgi:hypothetical protein
MHASLEFDGHNGSNATFQSRHILIDFQACSQLEQELFQIFGSLGSIVRVVVVVVLGKVAMKDLDQIGASQLDFFVVVLVKGSI